jgi:transcriptional regulator with XRE-family HTH domain
MANPLKYNPPYHLKIAELAARMGLTNEQIAEQMGISKSSLHEWFKKFPELKKIITEAKEEPDKLVIDSLFQRARGYSHKETIFFHYKGDVVPVDTIKHYPPETVACIFWLKNRLPKDWRDRHDINLKGDDDYQKQRKRLSDIFKKLNKKEE